MITCREEYFNRARQVFSPKGKGLQHPKFLAPPIHAPTPYDTQQPNFCMVIKLDDWKIFAGSTTSPFLGQNLQIVTRDLYPAAVLI